MCAGTRPENPWRGTCEEKDAERRSVLSQAFIAATQGARLAVTVEPSDIEKIHSGHGAKYPAAANNFLTVARKMFNRARIAGYVSRNHPNPTAGIVRFPERKRPGSNPFYVTIPPKASDVQTASADLAWRSIKGAESWIPDH
jgi:hypothetical protein